MVEDRHLHLHGRALTVGRWHHLPYTPPERRVGVGIERDPRSLSVMHPTDVRLVHVDLDLQCAQVGHGDHGATRETATDRGRDDLADFSFLAKDGATERCPDVRVLEVRFGKPEG